MNKIKITPQLLAAGYLKISNGNTHASIEERGVDQNTADKYFNGEAYAITISQIESKRSKTGSATNIIKQVQNYARSQSLPIIINPDAKKSGGFSGEATSTPLNQVGLERWYSKLGFRKITSGIEKGSMYWIPK